VIVDVSRDQTYIARCGAFHFHNDPERAPEVICRYSVDVPPHDSSGLAQGLFCHRGR
jgi:hypothetical protein